MNQRATSIEPLHGRITQPKSRAVIARERGELADDNIPNALEGGKFFPETRAGLSDPLAPDDVVNREPPRDGHIASGDVETHPIYPIPAAEILNEPGAHRWPKHAVMPGQRLEVVWHYHANHKSRRWKAFITKQGWDPEQKLSRAQFDLTPLEGGEELTCRPFWSCDSLQPSNPHVLQFRLPATHVGYHVLLVVWEVADTANAFYQVVDLDFTPLR